MAKDPLVRILDTVLLFSSPFFNVMSSARRLWKTFTIRSNNNNAWSVQIAVYSSYVLKLHWCTLDVIMQEILSITTKTNLVVLSRVISFISTVQSTIQSSCYSVTFISIFHLTCLLIGNHPDIYRFGVPDVIITINYPPITITKLKVLKLQSGMALTLTFYYNVKTLFYLQRRFWPKNFAHRQFQSQL